MFFLSGRLRQVLLYFFQDDHQGVKQFGFVGPDWDPNCLQMACILGCKASEKFCVLQCKSTTFP